MTTWWLKPRPRTRKSWPGRDRLNKAAAEFLAKIDKLITGQDAKLEKEINTFSEAPKLQERRQKLALANSIRGEGNGARIAVFKSQALRDPKLIEEGLRGFEEMDKGFCAAPGFASESGGYSGTQGASKPTHTPTVIP